MDEKQKRKVFQEAKILQSLHQPNIIQFMDVYINKTGKMCIVMEYADSGDLLQKIKLQKKKNEMFEESFIIDIFT